MLYTAELVATSVKSLYEDTVKSTHSHAKHICVFHRITSITCTLYTVVLWSQILLTSGASILDCNFFSKYHNSVTASSFQLVFPLSLVPFLRRLF